MKKHRWTLFKILILLIVFIFLLAFTQSSYEKREITKSKITIDYSNGNRFITNDFVNDIFSKTHVDYPKMALKKVQINNMENLLNQNEFIDTANVYLENNGILHTDIHQETPVIRVKNGKEQYYITKKGKRISLSDNYSAKVYIIEGNINKTEYLGLIKLVEIINEDKLLKNIIVGMYKERINSFILLVETGDYFIELGKLENISDKLNNFKIFYKGYIQKEAKMPYRKININFNNQVIAIK